MLIANSENKSIQMPEDVEISAILSENITAYVGTENAIHKFKTKLDDFNIKCHFAKTSYGFHSSFLNPIINEFKIKANDILSKNNYAKLKNLNNKKIVISNVNGKFLLQDDINVKYLCEHMLKPVRLDLSIDTLLSYSDINHIIEIGPPGMLKNLIATKTDSVKVIHTMKSK